MNNISKPNKLFIIFLLFLIISSTLLTGCLSEKRTNDSLTVIASIIPQKEMIESIGGEYVDVTIMIPAGKSPHSYEPDPKKIANIVQASLYFKVGSGIEFELAHMNAIKEQNPDLKIVDCSKNITILSYNEHYGQEAYKQDQQNYEENKTHLSDGTDPHIWTSPINFKKMAEMVYTALIEIDPVHQQAYTNNYQQYISQLDKLHENISLLLDPYEGNSFMVYHPSWGYFSDTYKLRQIAIEEEGKKPGPAGVAAIIEQARNENISVIFVSPQFDTSSAETIANEINGEVSSVNPLMSDYSKTLQKFTETLVNGYSES